MHFNQRQIKEDATFVYSPSEKSIENQGKNQIKAIEDHGKQLVESDEIIRKDFNINRDIIPLEKQKKIFNELVEERSSVVLDL